MKLSQTRTTQFLFNLPFRNETEMKRKNTLKSEEGCSFLNWIRSHSFRFQALSVTVLDACNTHCCRSFPHQTAPPERKKSNLRDPSATTQEVNLEEMHLNFQRKFLERFPQLKRDILLAGIDESSRKKARRCPRRSSVSARSVKFPPDARPRCPLSRTAEPETEQGHRQPFTRIQYLQRLNQSPDCTYLYLKKFTLFLCESLQNSSIVHLNIQGCYKKVQQDKKRMDLWR